MQAASERMTPLCKRDPARAESNPEPEDEPAKGAKADRPGCFRSQQIRPAEA